MLDTAWPPTTFAGQLTTAELDWALTTGSQVRYEAGECLTTEGDVLLICHGEAKVVAEGESGQRLLGFRGPGDLVGELAYLADPQWVPSVIALRQRPVSVVRLDRDRFTAFLDIHPRAALVLARTIAERQCALERSRLVPSSLPMERRVSAVLAELAWLSGAGSRSADVDIPLTQLEIAQLLDVAQVSVQRALRTLAAQELVRPGYRKIRVRCLACVQDAAGNLVAGSCRH
ncbi:Crp/Fnr family transcriptional regulator [Amycolatopsis sp. NPDC101161]|uniref:Crp/Fnr family transcriptional regulator n=1 Tax=Amycolatopsis sp. NPDC101161 TaxID=3363940 RepID=UPI0037F3233B